jgi:hypothetical protein
METKRLNLNFGAPLNLGTGVDLGLAGLPGTVNNSIFQLIVLYDQAKKHGTDDEDVPDENTIHLAENFINSANSVESTKIRFHGAGEKVILLFLSKAIKK